MKVSDLTQSERKVWQAAVTGTRVDLRAETERTVRAEVITNLLIGDGEAASMAVRRVRLQGAQITGDLNLEATTLRCPLSLLDCSFASAINLNEARAESVCLSGSHVPAIRARQLLTRGDLLLDEGFDSSGGVKLGGAHIGGALDCTGGHFFNPGGNALSADQLVVDGSMFCGEGFEATGEVRLLEAHITGQFDCTGGHFSNPGGNVLSADGLVVNGSMFCGEGFEATGEVSLNGAHITGQLSCTGGHFSNPDGDALSADRLVVNGSMFCGEGFEASGEVRLPGTHIGGQFNCTGGHFSNAGGSALSAAGISVDGRMLCGERFEAIGEVSLNGAHITGQFDCTGGHFSNPDGDALSADQLVVNGDLFCCEGFEATGEVSLLGAHIGGQFGCTGGHFSNSDGVALSADGLRVDGSILCGEGFVASGEVRLPGTHITGQLDCTGGRFSKQTGVALNLQRASVSGPLRMESATPMLEGILDLTAAKTSSYHDDPASWPEKLRLDGFVYDAIEGASVKQRLQWLRRNEKGYSPQIYEQLAAVYHHDGRDGDARRILIEKQRCRFAQGNFASEGFFASKVWRFVSRVGGFLLDWMVGYGYRTWLAFVWVAGLLVLGTILFNSLYSAGDLTAASKTTLPPPFNPFFYTLDLLLPVVSLHVRDAWIAHGAAQVWSVIYIIVGWILATAVVLSLTGLLKRDVK